MVDPNRNGSTKAHRMQQLARVEAARETRRRAEFVAAERGHAEAASLAEDAAREQLRTSKERQTALQERYARIRGLRSLTEMQNLRATEQALKARLEAATQAQAAAATAEREAFAVREQAQEAFRAVSLRSCRRSRMADMLKLQERRTAMTAEEESLADELMERFREATT